MVYLKHSDLPEDVQHVSLGLYREQLLPLWSLFQVKREIKKKKKKGFAL